MLLLRDMPVRERTPKSPPGSEGGRERDRGQEADRDNVPGMQFLNWQSLQNPKSSKTSDAPDVSDMSDALSKSDDSKTTNNSVETDATVAIDEKMQRIQLRNSCALPSSQEDFRSSWMAGDTYGTAVNDRRQWRITRVADLLTGQVLPGTNAETTGPLIPFYEQFEESARNPGTPYIIGYGASNCFYKIKDTQSILNRYGILKKGVALGVRLPCLEGTRRDVLRVAKSLFELTNMYYAKQITRERYKEKLEEIRSSYSDVEADEELTWEEAHLTLKAACLDLHPPVYACASIPVLGAAYVVPEYTSLHTYLRQMSIKKESVTKSFLDAVVTLMKTAATAGLIMLDIKPDNMVVDEAGNEGIPTPYFIDIEPRLTTFSDASIECVNLVNTVLLLMHLRCLRGKARNENTTNLINALKSNIPQTVTAEDICDGITTTIHKKADGLPPDDAIRASNKQLAKVMLAVAYHYTEGDSFATACAGTTQEEITFRALWEAMLKPLRPVWPMLGGPRV